MGWKMARFAREHDEDGLCDIFREGAIAHLTKSGGVNEVKMGSDELTEGFFGALLRIEAKKLGISHVGHSKSILAVPGNIDK